MEKGGKKMRVNGGEKERKRNKEKRKEGKEDEGEARRVGGRGI